MKLKTIALIAMMVFASVNTYAQVFKFSKTDSIELSKDEIYSRTKRFVADKWNSANQAVQNDDKENGVIQVNSLIEKNVSVGMGLQSRYIYEFTVQFRFKDNKWRVEIYDVRCTKAEQGGLGSIYSVPLIQPFDGDNVPAKTQSMGKGLSKKQAIKMMAELKNDLTAITENYAKTIVEKDDF